MTAIEVAVRRTNDACEAWVRVVSLDGLVLAQVNAAQEETRTIAVITPSAGPYFVAVDRGPTATCAGATYQFRVALADATRSLSAPAPGGPRKRRLLRTFAGRAISYSDVSAQLKPQLSVADVQSMVAALSPSARAMRNEAELCIEHLASTVRGHAVGRDRIPRELEPALKADGACTAAGAKALGPLAARVREG